MASIRTFVNEFNMRDTKKRSKDFQDLEKESLPNLFSYASSPVSFLCVFIKGIRRLIPGQKILGMTSTGSTVNNIGLATAQMSESLGISATSKETLSALYTESTIAKIWGVAQRALTKVWSLDIAMVREIFPF